MAASMKNLRNLGKTIYVNASRSRTVMFNNKASLHEVSSYIYRYTTNVRCRSSHGTGLNYNQRNYSSDIAQNCWKCGTPIDPRKDQYFCKCGLIQPPLEERTLFDVLDVKEDFDVQPEELSARFRSLQRLLHPDKFSQKSDTEKEMSALQSAMVNKAYSTLLKPVSRGLYMLEIHGHSLEEGEIQLDAEFLMEIMEINEDLVEVETLDQLQKIASVNNQTLNELIMETSKAFKAKDIPGAKALLSRLKYYANIADKVKEHELSLLGKL